MKMADSIEFTDSASAAQYAPIVVQLIQYEVAQTRIFRVACNFPIHLKVAVRGKSWLPAHCIWLFRIYACALGNFESGAQM